MSASRSAARVLPANLDQVCALPEAMSLSVPDEYVDANGHMNVRRYLAVHDDAGWGYFAELGFDEHYIDTVGRGFFDLEHHLRYLDEVLVGDHVTVHVRLLERSDKVVHLMSYLVNRTRRRVANTLELTTAHVDLRARRTVPIRASDATALDRRLELDRALSWTAQTCGAIGLRGKAERTPGCKVNVC